MQGYPDAMATTSTIWTAEMLERMPDDGRRRELVRGELIEMAPVNLEHALVVGNLCLPLLSHVRRERLGRVYVGDPGFHLQYDPDTVLAPDIAFVRAERVPGLAKMGFPKSFQDLAVEVLSPSNTAGEMVRKIAIYLQTGVTAVWIVDPSYQLAEMHRREQVVRLGLDDCLEDADLLPGLSIRLRDLFEEP
jgi:Uma2 family endonuclease